MSIEVVRNGLAKNGTFQIDLRKEEKRVEQLLKLHIARMEAAKRRYILAAEKASEVHQYAAFRLRTNLEATHKMRTDAPEHIAQALAQSDGGFVKRFLATADCAYEELHDLGRERSF